MMGLAGLLLLAAGGLRVYQLLTEPENPDAYVVDTWLFGVIQSPLEIGLGIWLLSGLFKKAGWAIAQIGFGVFICVTIWRTVTGQESCGCFGNIHVDPKITLYAIDIPIFLGLAIFYPRNEKLLPPPWPNPVHFICIAIPTAVLLSAMVPTLIFNKPKATVIGKPDIITPQKQIEFGPGKIIPIDKTIEPESKKETVNNGENTEAAKEPQTANTDTIDKNTENTKQTGQQAEPDNNESVGPEKTAEQIETVKNTEENINEPKQIEPKANEWEVIARTDIADTLRNGTKIILLYREDCDVCHEAMPMFEEYAEQFGDDEDSVRIAFVELPPYSDDPDNSIISKDTKCLLGKYNSDKKVFGATPIIVITQTGVPIKAWDGTDPIPTFDDLMEEMMGD